MNAESVEAAAAWLLSLTSAEVRGRSVSLSPTQLATRGRQAVALSEAGRFTIESISDAARWAAMDGEQRGRLFSFVTEPIIWNGGDLPGNGQHRVRAMKLAGVAALSARRALSYRLIVSSVGSSCR